MSTIKCASRNLRASSSMFLMFILFCGAPSADSQTVVSGDPEIDIVLMTYTYRAGGSGGAINRTNKYTCGAPSNAPLESNCPNDATYTPSSFTGGSQSWGVGINTPTILQYETECGWYWRFDISNGNVVITWVFECRIEEVPGPGISSGRAITRLKWGSSTDPSVDTGPTSTLAFRENLLEVCNPIPTTGTEAICTNTINSSHVEDPGYETEISIHDRGCRKQSREGGILDAPDGCFYPAGLWFSSLPAPYLDTTFEDPGWQFSPSIGSADAGDIDAGMTYTSSINFYSSGRQTVMLPFPSEARHTGAITTDINWHPVCIIRFQQPAWCFFGIDTASVGGSAKSFVQYSTEL